MSASVRRWIFFDPKLNETYTVMYNPDAMTSPFPKRKFIYNATTAGPDGGTHVTYETLADPVEWQFSGQVLARAHYDALLHWSQKKNLVHITDHFGRVYVCLLEGWEPIPKRAIGKYWRHTYTMTAVVYSVGTAPDDVVD